MKDRVKEFKRIPASELNANPKNWRTHPREQVQMFEELMEEVGFADVVVVREVDGGYELIDGHMRTGMLPNEEIPAIVVDLNDEEADLLLATMDPLGAMAKSNTEKVEALRAEMSDGMKERLRHIPTVSREVVDERQPVTRDPLVCPSCGYEFS